MELKDLGVRKGDNAFKVYKFLDSPEPTMKEKMEIKRKYSLMAGIKPEGQWILISPCSLGQDISAFFVYVVWPSQSHISLW